MTEAMTTYPTTPERPITRAETDRLTAIIKQLEEAQESYPRRSAGYATRSMCR